MQVQFLQKPSYRFPLSISPSRGAQFSVSVPLLGYQPVLVSSDGAIVQEGQRIDLAFLRGASAISPGPTELYLDLKTKKRIHSAFAVLPMDGELALASIRSVAEEFFSTTDEQDATIDISFAGSSVRPVKLSRYRRGEMDVHDGLILAKFNEPDAIPVCRMLADPGEEHALILMEYGETQRWQLPPQCVGTCIAYLRKGNDVISRPVLVKSNNPAQSATENSIQTSIRMDKYDERIKAIRQCFDSLSTSLSDERREFDWLMQIVAGLRNLSPTSLDVLKTLPTVPALLIRLLLRAKDGNERLAIWQLESELPFVWLALPLASWKVAMRAECESILNALHSIPNMEAMNFADRTRPVLPKDRN